LKIVLLAGDAPNQRALAHKLAAACDLAAVVVSQNVPRKPPTFRALLPQRIDTRLFGRPFLDAWRGLQERYTRAYDAFPDTRITRVRNVNDDDTVRTIEEAAPDLVLVSGTNIVGKKVMEAGNRRGGVWNLHTGVSPYIKGGPNCTNWCLATGDFHLIGSTIMWIDAGIDTGALITTERTPLSGREDLHGLHWKVMEHAHALYVRALVAHRDGKQVARVPQAELAEGRTFYNLEWRRGPMLRALYHFKTRYSPSLLASDAFHARVAGVRLQPLPA
jgi:methionyl-tRNA formyltransferase